MNHDKDCERIGEVAFSILTSNTPMTITERIEAAINAAEKPTAIVIGGMEALELMDWMNDQRWIHGPAIRFKFVRINELESLTYNGLPIRLSENNGIDILT